MSALEGKSREVDGCVRPAAGPLIPEGEVKSAEQVKPMVPLARVGKEAPDFEATAYIPGEGFKLVKLSDYRGKWVVLCFYPGDFTSSDPPNWRQLPPDTRS